MIATQRDRIDPKTGATAASTLEVRFGNLRGRFEAPHVIARGSARIDAVELAVNSRGAAVLAWATSNGDVPGAVFASVRPSGGAFGPPIRLGGRSITAVTAAVGPLGDMLVAWNSRGVHARFKPRGERAFGAVERVRSKPGASPQAVVMADGSAWLGWFAQSVSSAGTIGFPYIQVARRPPGARYFDAPLLLARGRAAGGRAPGTEVAFAAGPRGTAAMAWMAHEPASTGAPGVSVVRVALVEASGRFTVEELARSGAETPAGEVSLTFAADGRAAVAWTAVAPSGTRPGAVAHVSERPARGPWSTAAAVATDPASYGIVAVVRAARRPADRPR